MAVITTKKKTSRPVLTVLSALLAIAALLLVAVCVHPSSESAAVQAKSRYDMSAKVDAYMNNAHSYAMEDITYIRKIYTIPENATVAPAPDRSLYHSTDDPAELVSVIDGARELLDGQDTVWNPDIELMPGSAIQYYCDDTILVITWKEVVNHAVCTFAEVKIAHGSQIRRTIAGDSYGSGVQLTASSMAEASNAVVAINGDFYTFRSLGITAYQRELYRCQTKNVDSCFFTAGGGMLMTHKGELSEEEDARKFIEDNDVVFAVAFGPILVENGELQHITSYPIGEIDKVYARSAIGSVDELHYILMTVNTEGANKNAATINQAAQYMYDKGCISAYALDGGQTAVITMNGAPVNRVEFDAERTMSDIIGFATAKTD